MKRIYFFFLFAIFAFLPQTAFATLRYVSSSGSGTTCLVGTPCTVAQAISVAVAGDHIFMASGTYTGANGMITCSAKNGVAGNPIQISASTDGAVLIDGQDARVPIELVNCDYWIIEGVNAANSTDYVVGLSTGADNNIVRRVVAWDALLSANTCIFWAVNGNTDNLFEDVAAFGTGRKQFCNSQGGENLTIRRAFGIWNFQNPSDINNGDGPVFTNAYNSSNAIYENVIGTWDDDPGVVHHGQSSILGQDHNDPPAATCTNDKYFGSIAYHKASQDIETNLLAPFWQSQYVDCSTIKDIVSYSEDAVPDARIQLSNLSNDSGYPATGTFVGTNITDIGISAASIGSEWAITNRATGTSVSAVYGSETLYVNNGAKGATICNRYVDGVLTDTKLWPWPMNQRIIDAMTSAGRTPVDVDSDIQGIFGTYPSSCTAVVAPPSTIIADSVCTGTGSGTSITFSCTVGDHTNRESILFVAIGTVSGTTISSANYNGDSFGSQQCIADAGAGGTELILAGYTLIAPDTGTHTLTVNLSDTPNALAAAMLTFYNVDQTSPYRASSSMTNAGSGSSLTVNSEAGDFVVDGVYAWNSTTLTPGSGQTALFSSMQVGSDPDYLRSSVKLSTGAQTNMLWTFSTNSDRIGACDFSLIPNPLSQPNFKNVFASPVLR